MPPVGLDSDVMWEWEERDATFHFGHICTHMYYIHTHMYDIHTHTHTHYNASPHFKIWPTTKNKIKYLKNIFYSFFIWLVKSDVSSESQKSVLILANDIFHCQEFIMHGRKIRSDNEERHRHRLKWKRKWKDRERLEEERKRQTIT